MIEYYIKRKSDKKFIKTEKYSKGCWINVENPTDTEVDSIVEEFKLSKNNLTDGLDIHENPRFEIEDKKAYIFLTTPTDKITGEHDSSFLIIYSKEIFMTISKYSLETINKVLTASEKTGEISFSKQLLKILFVISRTFELSVRNIIRKIKKDKRDLNKLTDKDIAKLIQEEDKLNAYISSFGAIIQTYNRVLREKTISLFKKDEETIEDLIIDLNETLTLCKNILKSITNMRDYYSTKLSNDLNKKVTLLTIFTIFLTIPTLVSGIYGMNINLPLQNSSNIFMILCFLVIGIWTLMFFILKKFKVI